jgi:cold shock protein
MGKYRDHRQPRSRGSERYQSAEGSEPSYFQQRTVAQRLTIPDETASSSAVDARLLWFNAEKGFGFVSLDDGSDAFLHGSKLQAAGHGELPEGAVLKVRTGAGLKGPQVVEVLFVNFDADSVPPASTNADLEPPIRPDLQDQEIAGVVKRYDEIKGFGFIKLDQGDVFVHATALTRNGLSKLDVGQNVFVRCGQGRKGLEVQTIHLG